MDIQKSRALHRRVSRDPLTAVLFALGAVVVMWPVLARDGDLAAVQGPGRAVSGRVIDAENGAPVPNATVVLGNNARFGASPAVRAAEPGGAITDANGHFAFVDVAPKIYSSLSVSASGFVSAFFGPAGPSMTPYPFEVKRDADRTDVVLRIWRSAAIAGTVLDDLDEPVVEATVVAYREEFVAGHARHASVATAKSDDRGRFRLAGLPPGRYRIGVPSRSATVPVTTVQTYGRAAAADTPLTAAQRAEPQRIASAGGPSLDARGVVVRRSRQVHSSDRLSTCQGGAYKPFKAVVTM